MSPVNRDLERSGTTEGQAAIGAVVKHWPPGVEHTLAPRRGAAPATTVKCKDGVLKELADDARRGLPLSEGGRMPHEAIEVKGYLLGTVDQTATGYCVTIERRVSLPMRQGDAGDIATFAAGDGAKLQLELRRYPALQLLGSYHSHPNHEVALSELDLDHLASDFREPFQIAAIVQPRRREIGFFVQAPGKGFAASLKPAFLVKHNTDLSPILPKPVGTGSNPPPPPPPRRKWAVAAGAVVLVVSAGLFILKSCIPPPPPDLAFRVATTDGEVTQVGIDISERSCTLKLTSTSDESMRFRAEYDGDRPTWFDVSPESGVLEAGAPFPVIVTSGLSSSERQVRLEHTVDFVTLDGDGTRVSSQSKTFFVTPVEQEILEDEDAHPWSNWGQASVRDAKICIEVRSPDSDFSFDVKLSAYLDDSQTPKEIVEFEIPSGKARDDVEIGYGSLRSASGWSRASFSVSATGSDPGNSRWASTERVSVWKQTEKWEVAAPQVDGTVFTFILRAPSDCYDDLTYTVHTSDGKQVGNSKKIASGGTDKYRYDAGQNRGPLTFRTHFYGRGGVFFYESDVVRLASDDWAFIDSQGSAGKRVHAEHYELYLDQNLRTIGQCDSLRHIDDTASGGGVRLLRKLLSVDEVRDSWTRISEIRSGAMQLGFGELVWWNDESKVHLGFLLPQGMSPADAEETCMECLQWLSQQSAVSQNVDPLELELAQVKTGPDHLVSPARKTGIPGGCSLP